MLKRILAGDRRYIARAITMVENEDPLRFKLMADLRPFGAKAHIIGITGAPGAGKSTLVDQLIVCYRQQGLTVGVIAVDPSSPFTGGALLGDRIRMQNHATDSGVFIRSMGTRGSLGGLARAAGEAVQILAASGKDIVLVETVGVGQSETNIIKVADSTVVVLTPGTGDSIQTIKAGIMEIADIFVVNKADLPGAIRLTQDVRKMLESRGAEVAWCPPVLETSVINSSGIQELAAAINNHREASNQSGERLTRRNQRAKEQVVEITTGFIHDWLSKALRENSSIAKELKLESDGIFDPYRAAGILLEKMLKKGIAGDSPFNQ